MSNKHTPEPWRVDGEDRLFGLCYIPGKLKLNSCKSARWNVKD